jgi:hypothetical protein
MTHPILTLIRDAQARAPRNLFYTNGAGPGERALAMRTKIATVLALLEACEAAPGLDPKAVAKARALRQRIAHLPQVWEAAFCHGWEDGHRLKHHERHRVGPAARAMRLDVYPCNVLDPRDRLDRYPPWQAARGVCVRIRIEGERAARAELERRKAAYRAQMAAFDAESWARLRREREAAERRAEWDRRRQARELHEFRTGTQRRVSFPKERQRQRQRQRTRGS